MEILKSICFKNGIRTIFSGSLLIKLLVLSSICSFAQATDEDKVKAAFLYNFTHFVQWPEEAFEHSQSPFIIGVAGDNVQHYLEEIVGGENHNGHPIQVRQIKDITGVSSVHILYLDNRAGKLVPSLIPATREKPILTVSDRDSFMKESGIIRLFTDGGKIRMEINISEAARHQLTISTKLLNLAKIYEKK